MKKLIENDTWYLIGSDWFNKLKKYLGIDLEINDSSGPHPGCIDNGPLFKENVDNQQEIKDGLFDGLQYVLVPEETWTALVQEFGMKKGQIPIVRKVYKEKLGAVWPPSYILKIAIYPEKGKDRWRILT